MTYEIYQRKKNSNKKIPYIISLVITCHITFKPKCKLLVIVGHNVNIVTTLHCSI
jgi:hypothetical protein